MFKRSPTFKARVQGELACFTRPEFKVERVSYEVMTPAAARGILEAIMWKPAMRWVIEKIHVLAPIRFISFRRNEVTSRASVDNILQAMQGRQMAHFYAGAGSDKCAQRNTVALRDVDYVIEAHFVSTTRWGPDDNMPKFIDVFNRRLEKGQTFHQPYLGCREFAAKVGSGSEVIISRLPEEQRNKYLGWMLHDLDFNPPIRPRFFDARLTNGTISVPSFEQVGPADDSSEGGRL
jgi:CRISPR-associated protein Cas5d